MTTPKSRLAYQTHFDIFDQAMADAKGLRIRMPDRGQAWRMRLEMHHARSIDRDDNRITYDEGHRLHGCSIYDQLLITIEESKDETWLYLHKRNISAFHIENLSEVTEAAQAEEAEEKPEVVYDFKVPVQELEEATEVERRF